MIPTILTHRGLEPSQRNFFSESSFEAFKDQLQRGFGLEFDFNLTSDNKIIIFHDNNLKRVTNGVDNREIRTVSASEFSDLRLKKGRICFFDELANLLLVSSSRYHAFHIKASHQSEKNLETLVSSLADYPELEKKLLLFDLTINSAKYLKELNPRLNLAPSVAHSFDIKRYNAAVGQTLMTIQEVLQHQDLFSAVWLDEWDLMDVSGEKKFYTPEVFKIFKNAGMLIGLVTPELHGTSPGLLGGEAHPDSQPSERLFNRIKQVISLEPDIICTDYPEEVRAFI